MNLCIEVKLLREGRKSKMIEEISADITAYKKEYQRILFTVLPVGASVMFPEYQVKVKLNEFFGFHFAVFGNTGWKTIRHCQQVQ